MRNRFVAEETLDILVDDGDSVPLAEKLGPTVPDDEAGNENAGLDYSSDDI